ncbi:MAG TPA: hypothetical protein VF771_05940 [Longimicrobiaceae bacterium]
MAAVSFILSAQRDDDVARAFADYREYLASARSFPPNAYELATSAWYFDFRDRRCPHDAWLEAITIREPFKGKRHEIRKTRMRIRLLGAYHDGYVEFRYPRVFSYRFDVSDAGYGHGDWRYDEFRVTGDGHLLHEIEWASGDTWLIESNDVEFRWIPFKPAESP